MDLLSTIDLQGELNGFQPIQIVLVNRTNLEHTWDRLVRQHHYLGYEKMFGPRIKYLALYQNRPLAAISFNRAALKVGVRDRFIGWDDTRKQQLIQHIACNNRFLILPWVRIPNLASHLLSHTLRLLRHDWFHLYGSQLFLVETFVDSDRYAGTCYKAAGWQCVGETQGFAKVGKRYEYHGNRKSVFVRVLDPRFRTQFDLMPDPRPLPIRHVDSGRTNRMMLAEPDYDPQILESCGIREEDVSHIADLLDTYLNGFASCYKRKEQMKLAELFIKGLLSDLDRKSIEPVALRYAGEQGVRPLQLFFKNSTYDDARMLTLYQQQVFGLLGEADGMINVDGSDFPKKGSHSVGVARQHCGILGKTDNCQAGVFVGYSSSKGYALLDRRLYMPKVWFTEAYDRLRKDCAVPDELAFQTKNQLATDLLQRVAAAGVPFRWIGCDSAFGCDRTFLESLPKNCYYFADVRSNELVFSVRPEMIVPPARARGRNFKHPRPSFPPMNVSSYAEDDNIPWQSVVLAQGAKGPIVADVKVARCVACASTTPFGNYVAPQEDVWLYIRRYANGRIKYSLCNAPADTSIDVLHRVATMRWPIEQCFEECKSHLGMGHVEARSYQAWHRHMLFVMIAHLFTQMLRIRFKKNDCVNHAYGQTIDRSVTDQGSSVLS